MSIDQFDGEFPLNRPEGSDASMFIQWKGTDVCMDFICQCGANVHGDGYFAYNVECGACGAFYQLGTQVIARRVDEPDGACLYLAHDEPDNTPPETVTLPGGQEATVIATVAEGKVLWSEEAPKFATGGVIEGPSTPITIDLSRETIITFDEAHHWTAETSPFRRMVLDRWVKSGRPLNPEEAREAEDAGLRVVEATAFEDEEPVFLPVQDPQEGDPKRPEQGHIVNGPRFQAALEEFRQKYERGEMD